jgi:4'-phosphopantetheinyl transferase EntD
LGRDQDASLVRFPSPGLSLSHCETRVVAAGIDSSVGLGIDYERHRAIDPRCARFFLDASEMQQLATDARCERVLLRLWTIKEAVFKACLANRGSLLADYVLDDPARTAGTARSRRDGSTFSYCSIEDSAGFLSLAVAH